MIKHLLYLIFTISIVFQSCFSVKNIPHYKVSFPQKGIYIDSGVNIDNDTIYVVTLKNDTLHGPCWLSRGINGWVMAEFDYKYAFEALADGGWTEGNYEKGLKQGEWRHFSKGGNLRQVVNYQEDRKHGILEKYYEDGTLYEKANYRNDTLHGKAFGRFNNISWQLNYENGRVEGAQKLFLKGAIQEEAIFKNGAIIDIKPTDQIKIVELDDKGNGHIEISRLALGFSLIGLLQGKKSNGYFMFNWSDGVFTGTIFLNKGFLQNGILNLIDKFGKQNVQYEIVEGAIKFSPD